MIAKAHTHTHTHTHTQHTHTHTHTHKDVKINSKKYAIHQEKQKTTNKISRKNN